MITVRTIARPLLASIYISGGVNGLRNPDYQVNQTREAGLARPEQLVQVNNVVHLVAGLGLATNKFARLSALALAGTLVPTTYVGHSFWSESDPAAKGNQQIHFFKNLSMLGGLLVAAADTGGRESIPHAVGRVAHETTRSTKKSAKSAKKSAAKQAKSAGKSAKSASSSVKESLPV